MSRDLFEQLTDLPRTDVSPEVAARIRTAALRGLSSEGRRRNPLERLWTDFLELPATAVVVLVHLVWAVHAAAAPSPAPEGLAVRRAGPPAVAIASGRLLDLPRLSRSD